MPFYANGTRVNLNSASSLYQPADSEGATCNLTSTGTATPFYANGTQIYITASASWHTLWTGSTIVLRVRDTSKTTNITGLTIPNNVQNYRITYNYVVGLSGRAKATTLASALPVSYNESGTSYQITINSFTGNSSTGTATIVCSAASTGSGSFTLTKIEAYY